MTTTPIIMLAPVAGRTYFCQSGNSYLASSYALIVNVANLADEEDLLTQGCALLNPRSNVSTTRAPLGTDDFTAGYAIGSVWIYVAGGGPELYVCSAMTSTPGSATWTLIAINPGGSVNGPGSSTVGHVATFNNTGGTLIADSGVAISSLLTQANMPFVNPVWYGADPTGAGHSDSAVASAIAALGSNGGWLAFPEGKFTFASPVTITPGATPYNIKITGAGNPNTRLQWSASDGIKFLASDALHSIQIEDLAILTSDNTNSYKGLLLQNSAPENNFQQSRLANVTFQGANYTLGEYWSIGTHIKGLCNIVFDSVLWYGDTSAANAIGTLVEGYVGAPFPIGIVYNFYGCGWYTHAIGVEYGTDVQGVAFSDCNWTNGVTGVNLPSSAINAAQLTLTGCQLNCTGNSIAISGPLAGLQVIGCLFFVNAGGSGIAIPATSGSFANIIGNTFSGAGGSNNGISVHASSGNYGDGVVTGNVFYNLTTAVDLFSASAWNVQANKYQSCTTTVANIGGNSVGVATQ